LGESSGFKQNGASETPEIHARKDGLQPRKVGHDRGQDGFQPKKMDAHHEEIMPRMKAKRKEKKRRRPV
jgi:hypothetical protein